jgi:organic hydroperoxide reductase OsmC/OhrA
VFAAGSVSGSTGTHPLAICSIREIIRSRMDKSHHYRTAIVWTGNRGAGTSGYRAYDRSYEVRCPGKATILASSDPAFRGDPSRYNPEELLVASVSACRMLWYLHLCADAGVVVSAYEDSATGTITEAAGGAGRFTEIVLHPQVTLARGDSSDLAQRLHQTAHDKCFIANSVNFPIRVEPTITAES